MHSELLHIYGPISIQWYGLMIFVGLIIFVYAILKDSRRKLLISTEQVFDCISIGTVAAIVGGRILFLCTNWSDIHSLYDIVSVWDGGLSLLGGVIGVALVVPLYMRAKNLKIFELMDIGMMYMPLLQSISRLGCFMAGCCYGSPSSACWAVRHDNMFIHPAQLYSALLLFLIYIILLLARKKLHYFGQMTLLYLILASCERFVVDFWRGDREFIASSGFWSILSVHQFIALGLIAVALVGMVVITGRAQHKHESV